MTESRHHYGCQTALPPKLVDQLAFSKKLGWADLRKETKIVPEQKEFSKQFHMGMRILVKVKFHSPLKEIVEVGVCLFIGSMENIKNECICDMLSF